MQDILLISSDLDQDSLKVQTISIYINQFKSVSYFVFSYFLHLKGTLYIFWPSSG